MCMSALPGKGEGWGEVGVAARRQTENVALVGDAVARNQQERRAAVGTRVRSACEAALRCVKNTTHMLDRSNRSSSPPLPHHRTSKYENARTAAHCPLLTNTLPSAPHPLTPPLVSWRSKLRETQPPGLACTLRHSLYHALWRKRTRCCAAPQRRALQRPNIEVSRSTVFKDVLACDWEEWFGGTSTRPCSSRRGSPCSDKIQTSRDRTRRSGWGPGRAGRARATTRHRRAVACELSEPRSAGPAGRPMRRTRTL